MKATVPLVTGAALLAVGAFAVRAQEAEPQTVEITAKRLNEARNGILPETGSTVYRINQEDIEDLPLGAATPANALLLQVPGIAQDSFGQLHIRGDHANLQYRINGVIVPEAITGFGQSLDTRYFSSVNILTGALPAQYGYRTAGIVDIHTKSGALDPGGTLSVLGGSYNTINPSGQYGGTSGRFDYYVTGQYLQDSLGIENPTAAANAIHDDTNQWKGFAYASYLLNETARVSFFMGSSLAHFQIPNNPGQAPNFSLYGGPTPTPFDSADLDDNQREILHYGALAFQGQTDTNLDYQVALFSRYTQTSFTPDPTGGDLIFHGVSSKVYRSNYATGLQGDGAYRLNPTNTLRSGFFLSLENAITGNTSQVFPTDPSGNQLPGAGPITIVDNNSKVGGLYGIYLQDEWRPTQQLTINVGLRLDHVNAYVTGGQVSPRIGMVYEFTPLASVHAGYARYFTPPPTELVASKDIALFANTTNAPAVTTNDPVQPERDNYFDVGATTSPIPGWTVGLDGYYKQAQNLLDEGQFGQALVFSPFNYAQGRVYGVELTNAYRRGPLSAYLNIAWSLAQGEQINSAQFNFGQDELDYIATHWIHLDHDQTWTASGGVSYLWAGTTFTANALFGSGLRSTGSNGVPNGDHVPAYTTVNLGVFRPFDLGGGSGPITGRVALVNLFDKSYLIRDGTGVGVGAPQFGMRRAIYLEIGKVFK